jgi:uncharacterized protein YigA (DUF484 family)
MERAWRLEKRRKELGSDNPSCFYCNEALIERLELEHPVTKGLDPKFTRVVCRNHHRTLELKRDVAGLTHNGRRDVNESKLAQLRRYMLLLAQDQDSIAEALCTPDLPRDLAAASARATAVSLRRKAAEVASLENSITPAPASTELANALPRKQAD